eukprot:TRINITY_DN2322_c0_g1_i2.p1 TRINITY_DN2322_c0_g1~~TRINITY_DN2322_c0_g1_i2.p1  ORF type:complete len:401 (+),score=54.99 TRINITY_DN2322_c0_g1_i2:42-1244(+)
MAGHVAAERHAECCICFDDLCSGPVAVFMSQHKRVCCHYFHYECVKDMCPFVTRGYGLDMEIEETEEGKLKCPMCREEFNRVVKMPDPTQDPRTWFKLVDTAGTGSLTKEEVRHVIRATCKISEERITDLVETRWQTWDKDNSGTLTEEELPHLITFVKRNIEQPKQAGPPHIVSNKEGWFSFWDEDGSGELDKDEVARALIKTFDRGDKRVREIQSVVESVWGIFDITGTSCISKAEFLKPDGLADTVIACLQTDDSFSAHAAENSITPVASPVTRLPVGPASFSEEGLPAPSAPADPNAGANPGVLDPALYRPGPWTCSRCTFYNTAPVPTCGICQAENPQALEVRDFIMNIRAMRASPHQVRQCVVCFKWGQPGEVRRSGYKCLPCVGKRHRRITGV